MSGVSLLYALLASAFIISLILFAVLRRPDRRDAEYFDAHHVKDFRAAEVFKDVPADFAFCGVRRDQTKGVIEAAYLDEGHFVAGRTTQSSYDGDTAIVIGERTFVLQRDGRSAVLWEGEAQTGACARDGKQARVETVAGNFSIVPDDKQMRRWFNDTGGLAAMVYNPFPAHDSVVRVIALKRDLPEEARTVILCFYKS